MKFRPEVAAGDLLQVDDLEVSFTTKHGEVHAVSGVSFSVRRGETLSLVGESGSGKSTIAKAIMGLLRETTGSVRFADQQLVGMSSRKMRKLRPRLQMIFQDPTASLNPRRRVRDIVSEGLDIWPARIERTREEDVDALLREVGLRPEIVADRRPGEFSGGQCQRVAIARALTMRPELVVCDEPVSALDVSVQAQILNLMRTLKAKHSLTLLFISHDLSVVRNISDRVMVMYLGKICEVASTEDLFDRPAHPYTRLLLDSVPRIDATVQHRSPGQPRVVPDLPSPLDPPSGCRFRTRCPIATEVCAAEEPKLEEIAVGQWAACHHMESEGANAPTS